MLKWTMLVGGLAVVAGTTSGCVAGDGLSEEELATIEQAVGSQLAQDCATQCATSQALGCGETEAECVAECLNVEPIRPGCRHIYGDLIECAAELDASGFACFDGVAFITSCFEQASALSECQAGPSPQGLNGLCRAQCNRLSTLECADEQQACYEQCTFWSEFNLPCGREFQSLMVCATQAAPEEWVCLEGQPGPVSWFTCLEEQDELNQCIVSL